MGEQTEPSFINYVLAQYSHFFLIKMMKHNVINIIVRSHTRVFLLASFSVKQYSVSTKDFVSGFIFLVKV